MMVSFYRKLLVFPVNTLVKLVVVMILNVIVALLQISEYQKLIVNVKKDTMKQDQNVQLVILLVKFVQEVLKIV